MVENPNNNPLSYLGVRALTPPDLVKNKRAPTENDTGFDPGTIWLDEVNDTTYVLVSVAGGIAEWDAYAGNVGDGFPITPYVVGIVGEAQFQTIQEALDAANAATGGIVYVQPGVYTENLTLYDKTQVIGTSLPARLVTHSNNVVIQGNHTPPLTGSFTFANIRLGGGPIFFSAGAGSADLSIDKCIIETSGGFTYDLLNWTGRLNISNTGQEPGDNGIINNTGGSICVLTNSSLGNGLNDTLTTAGIVLIQDSVINCPWAATTGTRANVFNTFFGAEVDLLNDSEGNFQFCVFDTSFEVNFKMNSTGPVGLFNSTIDTIFTPAISGSGSGTLTLGNITFLNNKLVAPALTLAEAASRMGPTEVQGNLSLPTSGTRLEIKGGLGTDAVGQTMLAGGTVTIVDATITALDRVFITRFLALSPAPAKLGILRVVITAGFGFTISAFVPSTGLIEPLDTSELNYFIVRQI